MITAPDNTPEQDGKKESVDGPTADFCNELLGKPGHYVPAVSALSDECDTLKRALTQRKSFAVAKALERARLSMCAKAAVDRARGAK